MRIKVCPNCGSGDINYSSLERDSGDLVGIGISGKYYCQNCGYHGSLILSMSKKGRTQARRAHKFKRKFKEPKLSFHKREHEAIRTVTTLTIVFFLMVTAVLMIPQYDLSGEANQFDPYPFESRSPDIQETAIGDNELVSLPSGQSYEQVREPSIRAIENALGTGQTTGTLVPLFFLFFVGMVLVLGIFANWHRFQLFR